MNNLNLRTRFLVQRVSQLINKPVNTTAYNDLPPLHKEVVADFFKVVEKEEGNIIDRVETAIDSVSITHNVSTDVVYNYINKETGE